MDPENEDERRRQRWHGVLLALIGTVFSGCGVLLVRDGDLWMGTVTLALFSACALIGVVQAARPGQALPSWAGIIGALGFAVVGAVLIAGHFAGVPLSDAQPEMALPVGVMSLGFFGPGAVILIVREVRRRRRG